MCNRPWIEKGQRETGNGKGLVAELNRQQATDVRSRAIETTNGLSKVWVTLGVPLSLWIINKTIYLNKNIDVNLCSIS